jgi:DMSO/TMAO reductase YedYZ molybdopterin-dependent catalytic subunit
VSASAKPTPELATRARIAGAVSAGVALAVGELVSAVGSADQSLVGGVGNEIVDRAAGGLVRFAIDSFGTANKQVLVVGVVVVSLLLGALLGRLTLTRPWAGPVGFATFGLLGMVAGLRDPLSSASVTVVATVFAVASGIAALFVLLAVARGGGPAGASSRIERPSDAKASRRAFFGWAGAAGAFAAVAAAGARSIAGRSSAETARTAVALPPVTSSSPPSAFAKAELGVDGITPYLVPNDRFYRIDTALVVPQVEPSTWSLSVTGLVDQPFEIGFDELLASSVVEETVTLSCVSNEVGGNLVGNARWQGVPLRSLLDRAGVQPEGTQVVGVSVDDFTAGFPTETAYDGRAALVAVGMNGEPLPVRHGFPARLVVAGLYGYVSATKWLKEIRVTTWDDFDGYWIPRGWAKEGPVKTQSRIDVPRSGADLVAGRTAVAGVAWAPTRGIARVEVQVDEGEWQTARLGEVVSDSTWVQWLFEWDASPGDHRLRVRATDGTGEVQTDAVAPPEPDGATGWHTRRVTVRAA